MIRFRSQEHCHHCSSCNRLFSHYLALSFSFFGVLHSIRQIPVHSIFRLSFCAIVALYFYFILFPFRTNTKREREREREEEGGNFCVHLRLFIV